MCEIGKHLVLQSGIVMSLVKYGTTDLEVYRELILFFQKNVLSRHVSVKIIIIIIIIIILGTSHIIRKVLQCEA